MPNVSETTVWSIISAKKEDGTLRHHEEEHAYSMAPRAGFNAYEE